MATRRIKDITNTATTFASDDFIALDGSTQGTRKMDKDDLIAEISAGVSGDYLEEANNLSDVASLDTSKLNLEVPDVGTAPNEVPLNGQLGTMAYQDADGVSMASAEVETLEVTDKVTGQLGVGGPVSSTASRYLTVGDSSGQSDVLVNSANANYGQLIFGDADAEFRGSVSYSHSADELQFYTAGAKAATIDSSGRVGIGTASPDRPLHSYASSVATALKLDSAGIDTGVEFAHSGTVAAAINCSTGGDLEFRTGANSGANERLRITNSALVLSSGVGIDFGSAAAAGRTVESGLLDDYEEGSFSPTFGTTGTGFTTVTLGVINARYTKIGNCVTFSVYLKTNEIDATGATGALTIDGLPFAARSDSGQYAGAVNVGYAYQWVNAPEGGYVVGSRVTVTKRSTSGPTGQLTESVPADLTSGVNSNYNRIKLSGHYYTD